MDHGCNSAGLRQDLGMTLLDTQLDNNVRRVLALPFDANTAQQATTFFDRVEALSEEEVRGLVASVLDCFAGRHEDFEHMLLTHYASAARLGQQNPSGWSAARRMLLGSLFSMEYSIEGAALFNPSIAPHPDQSAAAAGELRVVMSLRAVGEGHISSTVFQTGTVRADGTVGLDAPSRFCARAKAKPNQHYHRELFQRKLWEMGVHGRHTRRVTDLLPEHFVFDELCDAITRAQETAEDPLDPSVASTMAWLARANYQLQLDPDDSINDLVLFPRSENESRGIEDMRLVRFVEDDGSARYFGTYTAYDGLHILPMLMETSDFRTINIHSVNGSCAHNKGMALFPRRIDGHYAMCSRIDGQRLFLMFSDHVHFWEKAEVLAEPKYPWELRLMGNCGSPIETEAGWLLLTHGVGPMRRYCIGAMLLDINDPFRIIGRLRQPLIEPAGDAREGYVPNVVYSCGGLVHGGRLYLPFAVSDMATRIATVPLDRLVDRLLKDGP